MSHKRWQITVSTYRERDGETSVQCQSLDGATLEELIDSAQISIFDSDGIYTVAPGADNPPLLLAEYARLLAIDMEVPEEDWPIEGHFVVSIRNGRIIIRPLRLLKILREIARASGEDED